ncbi:MAG: flagellar FliJ family protein [Acidobacteriaceae bacterium]
MNESLRIRSLALAVHQQVCEGARLDAWASEVELALAPARGRRLAVLAETARREAHHTQAAWMEMRRRRMEAETLHAAAERKHRVAIERKEQKDIDEWFLLRPEQKLLRDQASLRRESLQQRREF